MIKFLRLIILNWIGVVLIVSQLFGQAVGDYRSRQTGLWTDINTWERWDGSAWVPPMPSEFSSELYDIFGVVHNPFTVRSPHIVTVSSDVILMNTGMVEVGAKVVVTNAALFYNNGSDFIISGTLETGANGFIIDNGISGNLNFNQPGSTYLHNRDGGNIPTALWVSGSICLIKGVTTTIPTDLNQPFSDFAWDCPNQMANINLNGQLNAMTGSLQILNTNGSHLALTATTPLGLNLQNIFVNGSNTIFYFTQGGVTAVNINLNGSFIQAGGSSRVGTGGTVMLHINQNFLHQNGTFIVETNASFLGDFNGSTLQQWQSIPTQITGNASFTINTSSAVQAISDIAVPGQYLEFNSGNVILGNYNLHLGLSTLATGIPSISSFIDTNGSGAVIKKFGPSNPDFTFPVGSNGVYAPIQIQFTSFTPPATPGTVSIRTVPHRHPTEPSLTHYLSRYWDFISDIEGIFNADAYYDNSEVTGLESELYAKYLWENNGVWFIDGLADVSMQKLTFPNMANLIFSHTPRRFFFSGGERLTIQVTQPNLSDLCQSSLNSQAMLQIAIYNPIPAATPILTDINLDTRGSTNPGADLAEATFHFSPTGAFDPNSYLLGSVMAPNGPFSVNIFSWPITHGWNYFWVGYKLNPGSTLYNVLDAACESLVIDGDTYYPDITDPTGSRQIDQAPPIPTGTYTIGVGGDYIHFYEAVNELNCRGVSGPVVFEFIDTDYDESTGEIFPVIIETPLGVSAVNTVTFRPAAGVDAKIEGVTYAFPQTGLIILDGSDHIIFDGSNNGSNSRNLTIRNNSYFTSQCAVIHLKSKGFDEGATHNTIKNCIIRGFGGPFYTGAPIVHGIAISGAFPEYYLVEDVGSPGADNHFNTIENCQIDGTNTGIYIIGAENAPNKFITLKDNVIGSDADPWLWIPISGITCLNTAHLEIENNLVQNIKTSELSAFQSLMTSEFKPAPPTGILLAGNIHQAKIHNNRIYGVETVVPLQFGAFGIRIGGNHSYDITISNNAIAGVIADGSQTAPMAEMLFGPIGNPIDHSIFGIYLNNVDGCKLSHNTIHLSGQRLDNNLTEPVTTAALGFGASANGLVITNNVFNNTLTSSNLNNYTLNYAVYGREHGIDANTSQINTINYNLYNASSTGTAGMVINNVGFLNGNDASNLADWQGETGQDASSINVDVSNAFVDPLTDLHVKLNASESWYLSGTGVHDSANPTDADGVARPAAVVNGAPDLGAYEFDANTLILSAQPVNAVIVPVGTMRNVYVANRLIGQFDFTAGTPPTLTAKYYSGIWPPDPTNNGLNPGAKYFNCYLKVNATGGSSYTYTHTFHYDEALLGQVPDEPSIRPTKGESTPGSWVYYTTGFTLDVGANTFTKPGLTSFSDFTGSYEDLVLASGQLWLSGRKVDAANLLQWKYEAQATVLHFTLEYSPDAINWKPLIQSTPKTTFTDFDAHQIGRYYRVKAILTDGTMMYSNTIYINGVNAKSHTFTLFPNPVQRGQDLILHANHPIEKIEIYDPVGKLLYQEANPIDRLSIPIYNDLPTGLYHLRIYGSFGSYTQRFIVR